MNTSLIRLVGLAQASVSDIPGLGGAGNISTASVPPLIQRAVIGSVSLSSANIGGNVVPDLHASGDPMARITPVTGQPGPGAADSSAGLQAFIDAHPNSTIILPFDVVCNTTIHLHGTQHLRTTDPINGKHRIIRTLTYPWRVRPDQRATIGGNANPGYHPDMRCSTHQYDWRGGAAQEPTSTFNPYGMKPNGDGLAAGSDRGGFDSNDGSNAVGPNAGTFDGHHLVALDAITVGSSGGPNGNGVWPGVGGALWLNSDVGKVLQVLITGGASDSGKVARNFQNVVTSVTAGGRRIDWAPGGAVIKNVVAVGTMCWCIHYVNASWELYFTPNPGYRSAYFADPGWNNFLHALGASWGNNDQPVVQLHESASMDGIEIVGPNNGRGVGALAPFKDDIGARESILGFSTSNPLKTEFQNLVMGDSHFQTIDHCDIHHAWADGLGSAGNLEIPTVRHSAIHSTGRQGINLSGFNNVTIDSCEFGDHRHSMADIEGSKNGVQTNVNVTNNAMYGPHGMSWTSAVNGFTFTGNHSTNADVNGHGPNTWQNQCGLSGPTRSGQWQPKPALYPRSNNVNVSNNNFDTVLPASAAPAALIFGNCDNVTVKNNHGKVGGTRTHYYWQPWTAANKSDRATNFVCSGNAAEDAGGNPVTAQVSP